MVKRLRQQDQPTDPSPPPYIPLVVAYGMGVDSTAMLIGLSQLGVRPDRILFGDTGGEKPGTYAYLPVIQEWLATQGFPAVEVVRHAGSVSRSKPGRVYRTLEESCLVLNMLPSLAYGFRSCSIKWKHKPQERLIQQWDVAQACWKAGYKVRKMIGYDAGPIDSKRNWKITSDKRYTYEYPLREWGWTREHCIDAIVRQGLPVPPKSACFFCPAQKPHELEELHREHPELTQRIKDMEANATLDKIEGLWTKTVKGNRGGIARPGSMTVYLNLLDNNPRK